MEHLNVWQHPANKICSFHGSNLDTRQWKRRCRPPPHFRNISPRSFPLLWQTNFQKSWLFSFVFTYHLLKKTRVGAVNKQREFWYRRRLFLSAFVWSPWIFLFQKFSVGWPRPYREIAGSASIFFPPSSLFFLVARRWTPTGVVKKSLLFMRLFWVYLISSKHKFPPFPKFRNFFLKSDLVIFVSFVLDNWSSNCVTKN